MIALAYRSIEWGSSSLDTGSNCYEGEMRPHVPMRLNLMVVDGPFIQFR